MSLPGAEAGPRSAPDGGAAAARPSRRGPYAAAAIFGTIAGETVTANSLIFALPLVPPERRVAVAALLLAVGFSAGAATGVLLLRRWYRRKDEDAAARGR